MSAITSIVPLTKLDNVFPPTWDGTSPEPTPYIDPNTALRCSKGEDDYDYITDQRIEGDLFKRDLIAGEGLAALSAFLAANNGLQVLSPSVKLPFATELCLATFPVNAGVSYAVEFVQLGNTSSNFVLQVRDQTGTSQYSIAGNSGSQGWNLGVVLPSATAWSVVIMNTAGSGFLSGNVSAIITPFIAP